MNSRASSAFRSHFLLLDIQATGAHPRNGNLLEVAWAHMDAAAESNPEIHCRLALQPESKEIPPRVARITGIAREELQHGESPRKIWKRLERAVREVRGLNRGTACPLVIHFARYEMSFLEDLACRFGDHREQPLWRVICTHALCRKLLPELPRKGLRAVSGFLGHALPEQRRAGSHVEATVTIWRFILAELRREHPNLTLADLFTWAAEAGTAAVQPAAYRYPMARGRRKAAPPGPGIYRMESCKGDLLYVGKAKSLRHRVSSYFRPSASHPEHILEMLSQAQRLDFETTITAVEAALLEADRIKELAPPYNRALKASDRKIVYCSRDGTRLLDEPCSQAVGPLPESACRSFAALWRSLQSPDSADLEELLFPRQVPEELTSSLAREGIELFLRDRFPGCDPSLPRLKRLGLELYLQRRQEALESEEEDEAGEFEWNRETFARLLESVLVHFFRQERRARWLRLLADASLEWELAPGPALRMVEMREALVWRVATRDPESSETVEGDQFPAWRSRRRGRELQDPARYDRLTVLSTEIRRLLREGRQVRLLLGRRRILEGDRLASALKLF